MSNVNNGMDHGCTFTCTGELRANKDKSTFKLFKTKAGKSCCNFAITAKRGEFEEIHWVRCWGTIAERFAEADHKAGDLIQAWGFLSQTKVMSKGEVKWYTNYNAQVIRTKEELSAEAPDPDSFEGQEALANLA